MADETDSYVPRLWTLKEICARFQQVWLEKGAPSIEEFLSDVPENKRPVFFGGLLKTELELRRKNRESVDQADYVRRFPQYRQLISELFSGSGLQKAVSPPTPAAVSDPAVTPRRPSSPSTVSRPDTPRSVPQIPVGGQIAIEVIAGPRKGTKFTFDQHDTFLVGRSTRAQLQLSGDPHFSRFHFRLEFNPPQCYLIDLGSRNGTFVNGRQVTESPLQSGDIISGGITEMKILLDDADRTLCWPAGGRPPALMNRPSVSELPAATEAETSLDLQSTYPLADLPRIKPSRGPASSPELPETVRPSQKDELSPAPSAFTSGSSLGLSQFQIPGYELQEELACGDLGVLYRAVQQSTKTVCALKVLQPAVAFADKAYQAFQRECQIHGQLRHPHIVQFLEQGRAGKLLFIATEYIPTVRLSEHLRERRLSDRVRICGGLMGQILSALDYAHSQGLVHRDIKPGNIVITKQDNKLKAKLSDFGVAKQYTNAGFSRMTKAGDVIGSLPFMAPEQFLNSRDTRPAADLYSAGATLYTWLAGHTPHEFPAGRSQFLVVLEDAPQPLEQRLPGLPAELAAFMRRALAKEPAERFASASEMRQALKVVIKA
ncbi:MAG: protein kinase [Planctomycetaceae bacterium]